MPQGVDPGENSPNGGLPVADTVSQTDRWKAATGHELPSQGAQFTPSDDSAARDRTIPLDSDSMHGRSNKEKAASFGLLPLKVRRIEC